MLPSPPADENTSPAGTSGTHSGYSVDKIIKMAKRVGEAAQARTSRTGKKADRGTAVVSNDCVRVIGRKAKKGASPLLNTAIDTISFTLVSKRTGVAVIVAHTRDECGNRGIGCDVISMKPKVAEAFKSAVQASIDNLNRRVAENRRAAALAEIPPPYSEASRVTFKLTPTPLYTPSVSHVTEVQQPRLHIRGLSTLVDNDETSRGCVCIDEICSVERVHNNLDSEHIDNLPPPASACWDYVDMLCAKCSSDTYLDIAPHATCTADEPPPYTRCKFVFASTFAPCAYFNDAYIISACLTETSRQHSEHAFILFLFLAPFCGLHSDHR